MTGTMGLGLPAFIVMWTLMMTAMMRPSVSPLVTMFARTVQSWRALCLTTLATGYLLVWGASSLPAFALAWVAGEAAGRPRVGMAVAVAILGANGIYQLTP
jgi:predicted metal-binding membrane protein